jgi:hypothetical protein
MWSSTNVEVTDEVDENDEELLILLLLLLCNTVSEARHPSIKYQYTV